MISDEYKRLNQRLHETQPGYGMSGAKRATDVLKLADTAGTTNILDYGCGKGLLSKVLPFPIREYDPCVPGKDARPAPADLVVCTDVLEHVEPEYLDEVLDDLSRLARQAGYFVIHTGPALKFLADGRNAHLIQQPIEWWNEKVSQYFKIVSSMQEGHEIIMVVGKR